MERISKFKLIFKKISECLTNNTRTSFVKLLVVSKKRPIEQIMEIYNEGHRDFGENYVNELIEKSELMPSDINWHLIGHLQTNKCKKIRSKSKRKSPNPTNLMVGLQSFPFHFILCGQF